VWPRFPTPQSTWPGVVVPTTPRAQHGRVFSLPRQGPFGGKNTPNPTSGDHHNLTLLGQNRHTTESGSASDSTRIGRLIGPDQDADRRLTTPRNQRRIEAVDDKGRATDRHGPLPPQHRDQQLKKKFTPA
jgi:hypothetical protein